MLVILNLAALYLYVMSARIGKAPTMTIGILYKEEGIVVWEIFYAISIQATQLDTDMDYVHLKYLR